MFGTHTIRPMLGILSPVRGYTVAVFFQQAPYVPNHSGTMIDHRCDGVGIFASQSKDP